MFVCACIRILSGDPSFAGVSKWVLHALPRENESKPGALRPLMLYQTVMHLQTQQTTKSQTYYTEIYGE